MRKITVSEFVTLDGVMEDPRWSFPYMSEEFLEFKRNELFSHDTQLLGRVTYEGFASSWPGREDEQGYADRMNNMPKVVVSTTLKKADWTNSTIISTNVVAELIKLKEQPGQDILVFGSDTLVQTLVKHDLVDRYNLLIYPVVVGTGKHLFEDGAQTKLKLISTRPHSSGIVEAIYEPDRKA